VHIVTLQILLNGTDRHENSQSLSESFMEFLRALRERGLEGKWPEFQDVQCMLN
jgi:hypothetical protein